MNQIIESFLNTHIKEYAIEEMSKENAFEHFSNRLIINKYSVDRFDPNDVMTGKGEFGLDGIGIIVNDFLVTDDDTLELAISLSPRLDVKFVFIQSKTSESFDGREIGQFLVGVRSFFQSKGICIETNEKIENLMKLKDKIYEKSIDFDKNPSLELFYVTCGIWDDSHASRIDSERDTLSKIGTFGKISFYAYDADKITLSYKELKKKVSRKFKMEKRFSFPQMGGINQSYSGLIKCKDFINILKPGFPEHITILFIKLSKQLKPTALHRFPLVIIIVMCYNVCNDKTRGEWHYGGNCLPNR